MSDTAAILDQLLDLTHQLSKSDAVSDIQKVTRETEAALKQLTAALQRPDPVDLPKALALLCTVIVEAGQYRHETYANPDGRHTEIVNDILPTMAALRLQTLPVFRALFSRSEFGELKNALLDEILPIVEACNAERRHMPFRVLLVGRLSDRLLALLDRTRSPEVHDLLAACFDHKFPRFGTSGVRGLWGKDFTEAKAKRVMQAICDYAKEQNQQGKIVIVGHDSRINAREVAQWVCEVCVENGFPVQLADRDTPTPTLIYWAIEKVGSEKLAAVINCTASHNPVEWHGIKYSQPNGCPAPTSLTDWIASQANRLQIRGHTYRRHEDLKGEWDGWIANGKVSSFAPLEDYCSWLLGRGVDVAKIRHHFEGKTIVIDEMYGAGREYLREILRRIGVSFEVIHEVVDINQNRFGEVHYANPEPPYLNDCLKRVKSSGAALGVSMDADADRYGIVDKGGQYFRPNQILPMLVDYLVRYKKIKGKIVRTESVARIMDKVTANLLEDPECAARIVTPPADEIPGYINHPFYRVEIGDAKDFCGLPLYAVYVGIKYIAEIMEKDKELFRKAIIIGGEESSGLTTHGHLPDKDGPWACLLVMDMVANRAKSLAELWQEITDRCGASVSGRVDVGATDEVKELFLDHYLDLDKKKAPTIAGRSIRYLGGVRYDNVEVILEDPKSGERSYLIVRASGTEPLVRIYTESSTEEGRLEIERAALEVLAAESAAAIAGYTSLPVLIDALVVTTPWPAVEKAVRDVIVSGTWSKKAVTDHLHFMRTREDRLEIEWRNREIVSEWQKLLA